MTKKPRDPIDPTDMSHPLSAKDPLSPFFDGDQSKENLESDSDQKIEDEEKVGPGRPPKKHRWKKGCPSPWPKGRPKKVQSMRPDLKKMFEDALNEKIEVTKADKKIVLTRLALGLKQLATQFARGDRHARRDVFTYAAILGVDLQGKEILAEALGIDDQAIADAFVRRQASSYARPGSP